VKAYLAYSHTDKVYVDFVAHRLTRARVIHDTSTFAPGQDFRDLIRDGLDHAALFVLFASRASLASTWVRFEINEAEMRRISAKLQGVLTVIIDPHITPADLPEWMRRGRMVLQPRAVHAARLILQQLIYQTGAEQQSLFFGREELMSECARQLVPSGGGEPPRVFLLSGLDGVGRRSVARRALRDNLFLEFGPTLHLEETATTERLYMLMLDETAGIDDRESLRDASETFRQSTATERARLMFEQVRIINSDNATPVIVDEGILLDEHGRFIPEVEALFELVATAEASCFLTIIQRRRPWHDATKQRSVPVAMASVPPLSLDATKRLLIQSLKAAGLGVPAAADVEELAPFLGGYPPAVSLAVGFARTYGLSALVADKSTLVDFKVRALGRIVERLQLSAAEKAVLRALGMETALSFDVLEVASGLSAENLAKALRNLVDLSLVVHEVERYSLAGPVRDIVFRVVGALTSQDYEDVASRLRSRYWKDTKTELPRLDAIDATIYAVARSEKGGLKEFAEFLLPSSLLRLARDSYNQRDWSGARDFAERAVKFADTRDRAMMFLGKALVRLAYEGSASWDAAEKVVAQAEEGRLRGSQYLRGFLEWKRGNLAQAVRAFEAAERAGDRGVAVYRDRAHCLFHLGRVRDAERDVRVANDRHPRNPFVVDLAAQIAIAMGRLNDAEEFISELEHIDIRENFYYRRAMLSMARREFKAALADIERAAKRDPPLHEILATRANILVELGRYAEAGEWLGDLEKRFRGAKARDVHNGLWCKMALRQGRWEQAEEMYQQLKAKDLPVHQALRMEIVRQRLQSGSGSPEERTRLEEELGMLTEAQERAGVRFAFEAGMDGAPWESSG
jgi:tetratricopeptide (TPR) repeat protein